MHLVDDNLRAADVFGRLCLPQMSVVVLKAVFLNNKNGKFVIYNDVLADFFGMWLVENRSTPINSAAASSDHNQK